MIRLYFPPVEGDLKSTEEDEENAAALEKSMPDPPSTEPVTRSEPDPKRQKTASVEEEEDWEEIEKPKDFPADISEEHHGDSASNNEASSVKKSTDPVESKNPIGTNTLQKDW